MLVTIILLFLTIYFIYTGSANLHYYRMLNETTTDTKLVGATVEAVPSAPAGLPSVVTPVVAPTAVVVTPTPSTPAVISTPVVTPTGLKLTVSDQSSITSYYYSVEAPLPDKRFFLAVGSTQLLMGALILILSGISYKKYGSLDGIFATMRECVSERYD